MRRIRTHAVAAPTALFAAALFCAALVGCNNYCLNVQTNPGGTIDTSSNCPASPPTGNVSLAFGTAIASDAATNAGVLPLRAPHIFVTLRGIDALPTHAPGADAPEWQPLAPQLASRPAQVDLNARVGDFCATSPITGPPGRRLVEPGGSAIPAGVYSQLRLRLVPNLDPNARANDAAAPFDASACGANILSCVIPPDGAALPLAFDNPGEIVIPSGRIAGGFVRVLPGSNVHLVIALDPSSPIDVAKGNALRLSPLFSVSAQPSCPSSD